MIFEKLEKLSVGSVWRISLCFCVLFWLTVLGVLGMILI